MADEIEPVDGPNEGARARAAATALSSLTATPSTTLDCPTSTVRRDLAVLIGGLAATVPLFDNRERIEALRLADAFRARVIDATIESFVFEITGATDKIDKFVSLMIPPGLVEVSRTGVVAIARGPEGM